MLKKRKSKAINHQEKFTIKILCSEQVWKFYKKIYKICTTLDRFPHGQKIC